MTHQNFPQELDFKYYRKNNPDLKLLSDADLSHHYTYHGALEGRIGSPAALRENFIKYLKKEQSILEIGPFCNPVVQGKNVKYFDVLDKKDLEDRAKKEQYPCKNAPKIDFVSPNGDLTIVDESFSAVVSSHSIEHQPDFVRHLQNVSAMLEEDGLYYMLIPDKRYCFDALISETTIANIIEAFETKAKVHSLGSVIEHRALTTHNDSVRHWKKDHIDPGYHTSIESRTSKAISEFIAAKGEYIDVHKWQFTPENFKNITQILYNIGFIDLKPLRIYQTPIDRVEFMAILKKDAQPLSTLSKQLIASK